MQFTWNSDTIEYFKELYALNENEYYRKIEEFVKYECDLEDGETCLLYTSPSPRDRTRSRMPSSA